MSAYTLNGAIREAVRKNRLYRQGSGWIVSSYDDRVQKWRVSREMEFFKAREDLTVGRVTDAVLLLRPDADGMEASRLAQEVSGALPERVKAVLRALDRQALQAGGWFITVRRTPRGVTLQAMVSVAGAGEADDYTRAMAERAGLAGAYWARHLPDGTLPVLPGDWRRVDAQGGQP